MMEKEWLLHNPHLTAETMSAIEDRIPEARADVHDGLARAKEILGAEKYGKYLAPLQNLAKSGTTLLITTRTVRERTMLLKECVPVLKEAFGANIVKVVSV
ncbi:RNA helicase [Selenomonas sputigena]|uniref:RNA helicase n=1 Tax=Selenomonas sputigena TaxID=69823 RepID=A0ABV3X1M7_9FIRM